MKKFLFLSSLLALLAIVFLALPASRVDAQTAGQGKIAGQIINGTKDAKPNSGANLEITLYTVPQGATSMITTTTKTDTSGKFVFSNLDTISTTRYFLTTTYNDVDYFSDVLAFTSPNSTTLPADITIYEPTTDPSVIQVTQTHLVISPDAPWLAVQQIIAVQNNSDRVYIGKPLSGPHRATLMLTTLPKAINIQFDDPSVGQTVIQGDGVMTYTLPLGPGQDQIVYQYDVPFTPPTYDLALTLPYDTAKAGIFVMGSDVKVESQQLQAAPNPMSGVQGAPQFVSMSGEKLAAGTVIKAKLSNLPSTPSSSSGANTNPASATPADNSQTIGLVVLGAAAIAAVALLAIPIVRRRQAAQMARAEMQSERMDLLQEIADLDDEFEAGKITEAEYKEQRAALKAKLLELEQ